MLKTLIRWVDTVQSVVEKEKLLIISVQVVETDSK